MKHTETSFAADTQPVRPSLYCTSSDTSGVVMPQYDCRGGKMSVLAALLDKLQRHGPLKAASALVHTKPYGEKTFLLLLHAAVGGACLLVLATLLTLQWPRGLAAAGAADSNLLLLLRAIPAGVLLSWCLWLLRESFSAFERDNVNRGDAFGPTERQEQQHRAANFVFCLCATECWCVLLLLAAGCYTPAAALLAVPAACAIRCSLKNAVLDRCGGRDGEGFDSYRAAVSEAGHAGQLSQWSGPEGVTQQLQTTLRELLLLSGNFYGLPDVGRPQPLEHLRGGSPGLYSASARRGEPRGADGVWGGDPIAVALLLSYRRAKKRHPVLQVAVTHLWRWLDGCLFFWTCGFLLVLLVQLRAAQFFLGGGILLAGACCCFSAAAAAAENFARGLLKQEPHVGCRWSPPVGEDGGLQQRLLLQPSLQMDGPVAANTPGHIQGQGILPVDLPAALPVDSYPYTPQSVVDCYGQHAESGGAFPCLKAATTSPSREKGISVSPGFVVPEFLSPESAGAGAVGEGGPGRREEEGSGFPLKAARTEVLASLSPFGRHVPVERIQESSVDSRSIRSVGESESEAAGAKEECAAQAGGVSGAGAALGGLALVGPEEKVQEETVEREGQDWRDLDSESEVSQDDDDDQTRH